MKKINMIQNKKRPSYKEGLQPNKVYHKKSNNNRKFRNEVKAVGLIIFVTTLTLIIINLCYWC